MLLIKKNFNPAIPNQLAGWLTVNAFVYFSFIVLRLEPFFNYVGERFV